MIASSTTSSTIPSRAPFSAGLYWLKSLDNSDFKLVIFRTPRSWLLISIFYLVFYVALMLFFFALLGIFIQTLPTMSEGPRYTVDSSFIGKKPGVYWLRSSDKSQKLVIVIFRYQLPAQL